MHLSGLSLTNVRSFRRLDLELRPGMHVIAGPNGSGKSNLLEAIALLATTRSVRAAADADLISWDALRDEPLPVGRLSAQVASREGPVTVEVVIAARAGLEGQPAAATRRFRVNGVARRASDLIGRLRVVLFSADDLGIIDGAPAARRRYLDVTISQLDPTYVRALQRYQRVLQQRNSLLRRLQERRGAPNELDFWDQELAESGATVLTARAATLAALATGASARYVDLAPAGEELAICYRPALPPPLTDLVSEPAAALAPRFLETLNELRRRDIQAGATRIGPHRDDVTFLLGGHPAGVSASRGQQRSAALALRLAEVALSTQRTGDAPVLLLDDVLSELDAARRARVLATAYEVDQVFITTPDPDRPSVDELPSARRYQLVSGAVRPIEDAAG
ncbi:MAG: DNA replication/repair protein RecF [Dehalococcoidia bacterium]|nr:DNA replication/repair protein RecF [Dehalococcoidia bacterium]